MDTLLISLPAHGDDGIRWSVISSGASGATPVLTGSLGDCTHAAQGRRVIVLAPSEALLLACAKLTARNRTQLIKALPYALEEQLAQDIDDLHFAIGNKLADGRYPAAVVAK